MWKTSMYVPCVGTAPATVTDKAAAAIKNCVARGCKNLTFARQNKTGLVIAICGQTKVGITKATSDACQKQNTYTGAKR